jgi:hypothetical protein
MKNHTPCAIFIVTGHYREKGAQSDEIFCIAAAKSTIEDSRVVDTFFQVVRNPLMDKRSDKLYPQNLWINRMIIASKPCQLWAPGAGHFLTIKVI